MSRYKPRKTGPNTAQDSTDGSVSMDSCTSLDSCSSPPDAEATSQPSDITKLLNDIRSEVCTSRTEILSELKTLKSTLQVHEVKLQEMGDSLTDVDARVITLEKLCSDLAKDNIKMKTKLEDLENRSRRNNIRVIGIPERDEGPRPTAFVEALLLEVFGEESFAKPPVVDRAHRSLAPPPKQNQPPRPMIIRLHHFQTKELILRLSREKGQLLFRGARVHFYPDFSAELAKKRAAFIPAKNKLREAGLEFALLHPARLRVAHNGAKHFFDSPQEVISFIQQMIPQPPGD